MIPGLRRLVGVALVVGGASSALAAAGPDALVPFVAAARAAAAGSTVAVAFVVDFGGAGGPIVACVRVPAGTNGYQALADFTAQEGEQAPTYNASGLLCSVDGDPANGCGQAVSGGYAYWSYWLGGSGTWQYANAGAFGAVQPGDVEGWRFENPGRANPSDPPPGAAPDYTAICGSAGTAPAAPAQSAPAPSATSGAAPASTAPAGVATPGRGPSPSAAPVPAGGGPSGVASTTVPSSAGPAPSTTPGSGGRSASANPAGRAAHAPAVPAGDVAAGNGPGPAIAGGVLVAVLAGLAVWRWRRRPRAP